MRECVVVTSHWGLRCKHWIYYEAYRGLVVVIYQYICPWCDICNLNTTFNGKDAVDMNQAILKHIGRRHVDRAGIGTGSGEGIFRIRSVCRGRGVRRESELAYGVHNVFENWLSRGSFPTVRATAVGRNTERNAVLAGDLKMFRLLCNTNLNMIHT